MAGMGKTVRACVFSGLFVGSTLAAGLLLGGPLTDKGTQPGLTYPLQPPSSCRSCHADYDGANDIEPWNSWAGSMMAQASRDPLFWAALDVANNDIPDVGDFCLRCHVPQGWLAERSEPPGGSTDGCGLMGDLDEAGASDNDFEGVTCHLCHRMIVNSSPPAGEDPVYYENGQYWIDDVPCPGGSEPCRHGPYDYPADGDPAPHVWAYSGYHESSDLCGNCHNVTSPANTLIQNGTDTGIPFPIERTFREWQQSDFSEAGPGFKTCQNCHMPDATADPSYACTQNTNDHQGDMPIHRFAGGNSWVPELLRQEYPNLGLDDELAAARDAALDMLQNQSADVEITVPSQAVEGLPLDVQVKITNLTGHKLPTGYPEGRRMWINLQARDGSNALIWESGAYSPFTATLTKDPSIKIYETKPGVWNFNGGNTCDVADGVGDPIFHFVLNDCIVKDNRIPPLGFSGMSDPETQPVGYIYPETSPGSGILVNYDLTDYSIPIAPGTPSPVTVTATLNYQTASKEYIEFLLDEAIDNNFPDDCITRSDGLPGMSRGELLHSMWSTNGKSAPVAMGSDSGAAAVVAATPGEASGGTTQMLVTDYNDVTGEIQISYDPACEADDHTVYVGDLADVSTTTVSDRICGVGATGTTAFVPQPSGDLFWVIVGEDGTAEGSYGTDGTTERPEDTAPGLCNYPQSLDTRCDP